MASASDDRPHRGVRNGVNAAPKSPSPARQDWPRHTGKAPCDLRASPADQHTRRRIERSHLVAKSLEKTDPKKDRLDPASNPVSAPGSSSNSSKSDGSAKGDSAPMKADSSLKSEDRGSDRSADRSTDRAAAKSAPPVAPARSSAPPAGLIPPKA